MPLWEILIAGFMLPAFFFGWRWTFRVLAVVTVAKAVGGAKDKVMDKLKGDKPNGNSNEA